MANKSFPESLIKPAVSIVCTAAICITGAVCVNKAIKGNTAASPEATSAPVSISSESNDAYLTEAEAAAYLGLDEGRLVIMRKQLKYLEGTYMCYSYVKDGNDVEVVMYQKEKLDDVMADLMKKSNSINFKYLEEALAKAEAAK